MSNLTAIVLMMAIGLPSLYMYSVFEKMRRDRENEIVTDVIGGVPVSTHHRRILIYTSWSAPVAAQIGSQTIMTLVFLLMGENISVDGLRLLAHLLAFFAAIAVFGVGYQAVFGYFYLKAVLRQAEAD